MKFEKNDLYKYYNRLPEKYNNKDIYYLLLSDFAPNYKEIRRKLFPKTLNKDEDELRCRKDLLYLYLWDILFYQEYEYKEDVIWQSANHKESVLLSIKNIIEKNDDHDLQDLIFKICYHWPDLKRHIYSEDYKQYNRCITVKDYADFIASFPKTYRELYYAAKYKLSILQNTPFLEVHDVISLFNDSELIPIHELMSRRTLIGPLNVIFCSSVSLYPDMKNELIKVIQEITNSQSDFYISELLSKKRWHLFSKPEVFNTLKMVIANDNSNQLASSSEIKAFCNRLTQLTSLKFRLPFRSELESLSTRNMDSSPEWCYYNNEMIIVQGKEIIKNSPSCYAAFRLVVDK